MYMIYLYEKYRSVTNCTNIDMIYVTVLFPNMLLIIYEEKTDISGCSLKLFMWLHGLVFFQVSGFFVFFCWARYNKSSSV